MLSAIDWTRPWHASVRTAFEQLDCIQFKHGGAGMIAAFNAQARTLKLCNDDGMPLSFVSQGDLPAGTAYEAFIGATGGVPTRANLHDFFNALVWLSFPRIKRQLNALQAARIAQDGIGQERGATRDGATLFDENAALLVVRNSVAGMAWIAALRGHDWRAALFEQRARFGVDVEVWLFGHALMEKLIAPYKAITAHARIVLVDDTFFTLTPAARRAWIDARVAQELLTHGLSPVDFTPLPVLGVPDWWPGQDAAFYDDAAVFRPARNRVRQLGSLSMQPAQA